MAKEKEDLTKLTDSELELRIGAYSDAREKLKAESLRLTAEYDRRFKIYRVTQAARAANIDPKDLASKS